METTELRLNNWIQIKVKDQIHYGQVCAIEKDCVYAGDGIKAPVKFLEPLPLTPEWLEKAGFKEDEDEGGKWSSDGFLFSIFTIEKVYHWANVEEYEWSAVPITAVHELQNLCFAVTGRELEFTS